MPCCIADSDMPVSEVRSDQSILDMMNSEDYKDMRLKMLADEPVEACNRCYELENDGTWTYVFQTCATINVAVVAQSVQTYTVKKRSNWWV